MAIHSVYYKRKLYIFSLTLLNLVTRKDLFCLLAIIISFPDITSTWEILGHMRAWRACRHTPVNSIKSFKTNRQTRPRGDALYRCQLPSLQCYATVVTDNCPLQ